MNPVQPGQTNKVVVQIFGDRSIKQSKENKKVARSRPPKDTKEAHQIFQYLEQERPHSPTCRGEVFEWAIEVTVIGESLLPFTSKNVFFLYKIN